MIDYIHGGEYLNVTSNKGSSPYVNITQPITGMVGYDANSGMLKVYDGSGWMTVGGGSASINLSPNAITILKWAEEKMREEYELKALADQNPTIRDLVNQINEKKQQVKMVQTLLKSPGNEPQELMGS